MNNSLNKILTGTIVLLALVNSAAAQEEEEVYVLSPFEIQDMGVTRYDAGASLAASRIAIPNIELPASITTISEQLIEDTVALTVRDTFNMVAGVNVGNQGTGSQTSNVFVVRGYTISGSQRDGLPDTLFSSTGGFDYSLIERVEIVKGPSGILYGNHSPGGVVNLISKKPLAEPRTRIGAMLGSYNMYRGEIDTSNFFDAERKWGYRVSLSYYDYDGVTEAPQDAEKDGRLAFNPSILYRGDEGLQFWVWTAFVRDEANRLNPMTRGLASEDGRGRFITDKSFVSQGGGNNVHNNLSEVDVDNYEVGFSKSFQGEKLTADLRIIARLTERLSDGSRVRGIGNGNGPGFEEWWDQNDQPYQTLNGRNNGVDSRQILFSSLTNGTVGSIARYGIRWDLRPQTLDTQNYSIDYNLNFDTGDIRHSLLLFGIYGETKSTALDFLINVQADLETMERITGSPNGRVVNFPQGQKPPASFWTPEWVEANETSRRDRGSSATDGDNMGLGAIERVYLLDDRLIFVLGTRYTDFESTVTRTLNDVVTSNPPQGDTDWTSNLAGLYKLVETDRETISAFVNFNETFIPVFAQDERLATFGQKFPNRFAETEEIGLKAELMEGIISASLVYFDNTESDVLISFQDDALGTVTGIPEEGYRAPAGSRDTSGLEFELFANPMPGLDLFLTWSDVSATVEDGSRPDVIPESTASFFGRYELQEGQLAGFSFAWQAAFWGEATMGPRTNWITPSGELHNVILGYRSKSNWRLNLRVGNVFDSVEIFANTFETAVGVADLRDYRVSWSMTY